MAVTRQQNWLGQQRVEVAHLRALESAVAGDFDMVAGTIMAGKAPVVVNGFYLVTAGITQSTHLQLTVADSMLIHFYASESGSVFHVPFDRAAETLNTTNPRIVGSWTPSAVNYVGVDLIRLTDSTTTDLVQFIDPNSLLEDPKEVPLARTLDYRIYISAADFDSSPSVCPIAKVTLDAFGGVLEVEDAREFMFRLGSGGTSPDIQHSFPWVAGRKEGSTGDEFAGGDKAIQSFKAWMDATMTRLWEIGGGEYWYSQTADRNVVLARTGTVFVSSGEYFEWDGSNLHWKGLVVTFANSTGHFNVITDQTVDSAGLTDLADGQCIYVDIDRAQDRTGGSSLVAKKAPLVTLGDPTTPGSRWVLAWRYGTHIYVRDQSYAIGSSFKLATTAAAGNVLLSATDSAVPTAVATVNSVSYFAYAAGLSRDALDFIGGAGDIVIGGFGANDHNIKFRTFRDQDEVLAEGSHVYTAGAMAPFRAHNESDFTANLEDLTMRLSAFNVGSTFDEDAHHFESGGAIGFRNVLFPPQTPNPTATRPIRSKVFFRDNGVSTPNTRDQFVVMWFDGNTTVIAESNTY